MFSEDSEIIMETDKYRIMFDKPSGTITVASKGNGLPVAIKFDDEYFGVVKTLEFRREIYNDDDEKMNDFIEQYLLTLAGRE